MNQGIEKALSQQLRELYGDSEFKPVFDWFARRVKDSRETKVERAQRKSKASYDAVKRLFQALNEMQVGRYIVGRHGHSSRLSWNYSIKAIGLAAQGEDINSFEIDFENLDESDIDDFDQLDTIEHTFMLRKDLPVTVILPTDLSDTEAKRLSSFILSLPFE